MPKRGVNGPEGTIIPRKHAKTWGKRDGKDNHNTKSGQIVGKTVCHEPMEITNKKCNNSNLLTINTETATALSRKSGNFATVIGKI